ncbi:hypothetical protein Golax_009764 [Gossypium laxum]|uniref:Cytochrome P450 CYP749A22-like n=1 Tax=Gossypium laxum TaxID=34288 RepID=A0A7J8ZFF6_9ROSI|nr:hypothetical protein [Gossypium laxum]
MSTFVKLAILLPCSFFLVALIKFLYDYLWIPLRLQHMMNSQGIKGPPYTFIHGNNKEATKTTNEALSKPMALRHDIFPRVQPHVYSCVNRYGRNYLAWDGKRPELVITEPELVNEVLKNSVTTFPKRKPTFFLTGIFGNGLVTALGEKWVKQRKLANYAFHGESLKNMTPAVIASVETMLEKWKGYVGKEIESEELSKGIQDCVMNIVKKREDEVLNGKANSFGNDFLGLLVNAYHDSDENNRLLMEDLVDECKTFYFAGQDTVNSLLAWIVFLLAIHGDWQEKARREVIEIFSNQIPDSEGMSKLKTMTMIIYETLRLYGPPNGLPRRVTREVQLGKLALPASMDILVQNIAVHHDPHMWGDDVHLFKPERFAEGIAKATNYNAGAFCPFGLGPRNCVGMNFATMETKIVLSMILQRYTISLSPTYVHSPIPYITVQPQHGIQVILESLGNDT